MMESRMLLADAGKRQAQSPKQRLSSWLAPSAACLASLLLLGCGGSDGTGTAAAPTATAASFSVAKAACGPGDKPEPDLQGQVSAAVRTAGFKGYSCNLELVSQYKGDGASWQFAWFQDRAGHKCAYYDTSVLKNDGISRSATQIGTIVLDISDPANPKQTANLTTTSMLDPWESLKVNERRQLLGATQATNGKGGPQLDLYDLSGDCRTPQLLSSVAIGTAGNGDAAALPAGYDLQGHEGNFSPDGLTWYNGDRGAVKKYTAIDISNTIHPKLLTTWDLPLVPTVVLTTHGLNISPDGNRAYVSRAGVLGSVATNDLKTAPEVDGMIILDTSEVQKRLPNPKIKQVGMVTWRDSGQAQHTIDIIVKGKQYVVVASELGTGGNSPAGWAASCAAGLSPFHTARIVDIADETKPVVVSKLFLEAYDPANCSKVLPDLAGLSSFTYGSHYCSVDNKDNATTLACGYFNSGIRVFDIRDVANPKEIAYFNPPGVTTISNGSNHNRAGGWVSGGPDWCNSQIRLDAATASLQTICQDNGFLSLKFKNGVWPFPESTTPAGKQN